MRMCKKFENKINKLVHACSTQEQPESFLANSLTKSNFGKYFMEKCSLGCNKLFIYTCICIYIYTYIYIYIYIYIYGLDQVEVSI